MKSILRVGVALGSNLGDRMEHLRGAFARLKTMSAGPVLHSQVYETAPVDCAGETPSFLNAVCEIGWDQEALVLLRRLRELEREHGRAVAYPQNAPRPLDLDLLYAGKQVIQSDELTLPHPRMTRRRFVLQPLCDIRPDLALPGQTASVSRMLAGLKDDQDVRVVGPMASES